MEVSQWGLNCVLATHLGGMSLYEDLISRVEFQSDESGNLIKHQLDNLKSVLKVALRMSAAKDGPFVHSLRAALESLLDYGTEASSSDIREFLSSAESSRPLVLTDLQDGDLIEAGNVIRPFIEEGGERSRDAVEDMSIILRRVVQKFPQSVN